MAPPRPSDPDRRPAPPGGVTGLVPRQMPPLLRAVLRARDGATLVAGRVGVRALAASGDPVAQYFAAGPDEDPYPILERVRAAGPLTRSRTGITTVTSRTLCEEALRDRRLRVRDDAGRPAGYDRVTDEANGPLAGSFLELDPPEHTRLRRLTAPAFRPALVRGYTGRITAAAEHLLDDIADRPGAALDLMRDFAAPFPITVISALLGIPDVDAERFARIGTLVGQSLDGVRSLRQADALAAASRELAELFTRLAAQRRQRPQDDVLSVLAAAEAGGELTAEELVATCGLLLIAGFETTVNLVGNAVAALLAEPGEWERLREEPGRAPAVVEETLRYDPPVQATLRVTAEPVELAGQELAAGTLVGVALAAANRDPQVYRDPARFDAARLDAARYGSGSSEPEHLAFGSGIHYCLGAPLARLEGAIALQALTRRFPALQRAPGGRRRTGTTIRGFATLPVLA